MPKVLPKTGVTKTSSMMVKATIEDKDTKELLVEQEYTKLEKVPMRELKDGERYGAIRVVDSIKLSKRFQSIGIEVGFAEFPVVCTLEHPELNKPDFLKVHEIVEGEMVSKLTELQDMLTELGK